MEYCRPPEAWRFRDCYMKEYKHIHLVDVLIDTTWISSLINKEESAVSKSHKFIQSCTNIENYLGIVSHYHPAPLIHLPSHQDKYTKAREQHPQVKQVKSSQTRATYPSAPQPYINPPCRRVKNQLLLLLLLILRPNPVASQTASTLTENS